MSIIVALFMSLLWLKYAPVLDISTDTVFVVVGLLMAGGLAGMKD